MTDDAIHTQASGTSGIEPAAGMAAVVPFEAECWWHKQGDVRWRFFDNVSPIGYGEQQMEERG